MDYTQNTCREFVELLASKEPVPGGGGAAALVGAVGTALGHMVGSLTAGKKRYAESESEIRLLMEKCGGLESALLDQVEADAEGFAPLAAAYGIPKDDPSREAALEEAAKAACAVPMRIMELCCEAIEAVEIYAAKGSRLAVSDAGCAAACLKGALDAASLNVYINTKTLKDRETADAWNARCDEMLAVYGGRAEAVCQSVRAQLRGEAAQRRRPHRT